MRGIEHMPRLYDALMGPAERTGLGRWRRSLIAGVRGPVIEIGCGTGRDLSRYPSGVQLVATDPDVRLLRRARRKEGRGRFVAARAEALPFREGAFATAVSALVFCSVEDPGAGLREVRRVLRPNGELRMLEHVRHESPLQARLQDLLQPAWTWVTGGCRPNRRTERTVEASGFAIDPGTRRARGALRLFVARPR